MSLSWPPWRSLLPSLFSIPYPADEVCYHLAHIARSRDASISLSDMSLQDTVLVPLVNYQIDWLTQMQCNRKLRVREACLQVRLKPITTLVSVGSRADGL